MANRIAHGLAAGAAGTTALNLVTYADMVLRGRPPSEVPKQDVERLADSVGVHFGDGDRAEPRKEGAASLMGYVTGLGAGVVTGALGPVVERVPAPLAAAVIGLGVMAATDGTSAALGATDPSTWSATDWVSDIIPHLVFGAATIATYRALRD
jgi:hypothetical protein